MKTEYSRREVLTVGALALIDAAITTTTTAQAQTPPPDGGKTGAGDPKSAQGKQLKLARLHACADSSP